MLELAGPATHNGLHSPTIDQSVYRYVDSDDGPMPIHLDYAAIRVWHVLFDPASDWRALQKQAAKEDAPVDALYLNGQQWVTPRDLPKDHWSEGKPQGVPSGMEDSDYVDLLFSRSPLQISGTLK